MFVCRLWYVGGGMQACRHAGMQACRHVGMCVCRYVGINS